MLYGDEGKGPKRGNYLITCWESPIGANPFNGVRCQCSNMVQQHRDHAPTCYGPACNMTSEALEQACNMKSHSFLTRHLLFGLQDTVYKDHPIALEHLLELLAKEITDLSNSGFSACGKTWYVTLIAVKGDMKHMAEKWANMTRSYANLGRVNDIPMCSLCEAGSPGVPWEELSHHPSWSSTMFHSRPWATPPPFSSCPYDSSRPEFLYKLDLFHCFKTGIARDVAGSVFLFCRLGFYDNANDCQDITVRLSRAHQHFRLWALASKRTPALRYFSKNLFNVEKDVDRLSVEQHQRL